MSFIVVSKALQALKETFGGTHTAIPANAAGAPSAQADAVIVEASKAEIIDLQRRIIRMPRLTAGKDQLHFDI